MRYPRMLPLVAGVSLALLAGCHSSTSNGGSNVTMRDMEVVDGTANDSMVDLDNAAQGGTPTLDDGGARVAPMPDESGTADTSGEAEPANASAAQ